MKHIPAESTLFSAHDRQETLCLAANGLLIRDVVIDAGIGREVLIGHLSDIH